MLKGEEKSMEEIMLYLARIEEGLQQVEQLTENQGVVLKSGKEEKETFIYIEQMVQFKEIIIQQLEEAEKGFEKSYKVHKEALLASPLIKEVKERVTKILKMKEEITRREAEHLHLLMQPKKGEEIRKLKGITPQKVAKAYEKHQKQR